VDTNDIRQLRLQLLANGWSPIRNRDKRTFMKDWPNVEITPAEIDRWSRKHKRDAATGLRLDGDLVAIDFDIDDEVAMKAIANEIFDKFPELGDPSAPLLQRMGKGAKEAWFVRCDESFSRLHSRAWTRPGECPDDGAHRVEIFGSARPIQFGAFGPHTVTDDGEVVVRYRWLDRSPADTRQSELPAITKARLSELVDVVEQTLRALGWQPVPLSTAGENEVQHVHDLTDDMQFDVITGVRMSLRELREGVGATEGLRCSASWLEGSVARNRTRCLVSVTQSGQLAIWDSATGITHHEVQADQGRPVVTADLHALAQKMLALGIAPAASQEDRQRAKQTIRDPRELHRISPTDDAPTAAGKLLKLYAYCPNHPRVQVLPIYASSPEDGMTVQALKLLYAANNDEEIGPRGGRVVISPADLWVAEERRVNVAGIRMRPDKPWPIYEEDGEKWINCFVMPLHDMPYEPDAGAAFDIFIQHLLPDPIEMHWFLDWLAHKYQHPEVPGPGVIMVSPEQGAGRGTLFSMLTQLFGSRHTAKVDGGSITGDGGQSQYNRFLSRAVLILIDELFNAGTGAHLWQRKKAYDRIKGLIDPAARRIEVIQKTLNNFDTLTFASFLMATNNANALPLEDGDRRICVLLNGLLMSDAPHVEEALAPFRRGLEWAPEFIAAVAAILRHRNLAGFNAYAAPPMFEGKVRMIERNMTDVSEAADEAIEELPGDFVTRNDFVERVRMKMGDAARDHKNLVAEARDRLDRKWHFLGRAKIKENGAKADVWARDPRAATRWALTPWAERGSALEPNSDPKRKATEAQRAAWARSMRIIDGDKK
jgi:hypothetical protein